MCLFPICLLLAKASTCDVWVPWWFTDWESHINCTMRKIQNTQQLLFSKVKKAPCQFQSRCHCVCLACLVFFVNVVQSSLNNKLASSKMCNLKTWKVDKVRGLQASKLTSWQIDRLPDWQDDIRTELWDVTNMAKNCQMLLKIIKSCQNIPTVTKVVKSC